METKAANVWASEEVFAEIREILNATYGERAYIIAEHVGAKHTIGRERYVAQQLWLAFIRWYLYERVVSPHGDFGVQGNSPQLLEMAIARIQPKFAHDRAEAIIRAFQKPRETCKKLTVRRSERKDKIIFTATAKNRRIVVETTRKVIASMKRRYRGNSFDFDCFCVLQRYALMGKTGFQWAIPSKLLDEFRRDYNVTTECFASPINAALENYYSAFPDVDNAFGSLGNFFDANITSGAFEANPPFTEEFLELTAKSIEKFLDSNPRNQLVFVVIFPNWTDAVGYELLKKSKFLRKHYVLKARTYSYESEEGPIQANFDSAVFILAHYTSP